MDTTTLNNNIQMIQSYYRFLMLGKYMEHHIKAEKHEITVSELRIPTGVHSSFGIRLPMIQGLMKQIHDNPDKKNIFGYLVEISAFRGIFGIMRELLDNNTIFSAYAVKRLWAQYFSFEQTIKLVRNVLSHTTTSGIILNIEDFVKQRDFLIYKKDPIIKFDFIYAEHRKEWTGGKEYWIHLELDFTSFKDGQSLLDIVSLHQLYMLSELCSNLCELCAAALPKPKKSIFVKKNHKTIWKTKRKL